MKKESSLINEYPPMYLLGVQDMRETVLDTIDQLKQFVDYPTSDLMRGYKECLMDIEQSIRALSKK